MKTLLIVFAFLSLLQFGCSRCGDDSPAYTAYLTDCEKAFIPYNGDEVLKFLLNGDTVSLAGQGIEVSIQRDHDPHGDCLVPYDAVVNTYRFSSQDYGFILILTPGGNSFSNLQMQNMAGRVRYWNNELRCFASNKPSFELLDSSFMGRSSDTLVVLDKVYRNVYNLGSKENYLYYSLIDGFIKFKDWYPTKDDEIILERIPE